MMITKVQIIILLLPPPVDAVPMFIVHLSRLKHNDAIGVNLDTTIWVTYITRPTRPNE